MEKPTFTRTSLSDVRVIVLIMRVSLVEQRCQVATGQVPALKCPLLGTHGHLWLHPIMPGI
jgi:hypothetical protein